MPQLELENPFLDIPSAPIDDLDDVAETITKHIKARVIEVSDLIINMVGDDEHPNDTSGAELNYKDNNVVKINKNGFILRNTKGLFFEDDEDGNWASMYMTEEVTAGTGQGRLMLNLPPLNKFYIKKHEANLGTSDTLFSFSDDQSYTGRKFYIDCPSGSDISQLTFGYPNSPTDGYNNGLIYFKNYLSFFSGGNLYFKIVGNEFWSGSDGGSNMGGASNRFANVFAVNVKTTDIIIYGTKLQVNSVDYSRIQLNYKDHSGVNQTLYVLASTT